MIKLMTIVSARHQHVGIYGKRKPSHFSTGFFMF
jgi:hypothetical protein